MKGGFSNPERIVKELHVPKGAHVADLGAGSGYFTLLVAQQVGENGVVTAVDVLPSALEVIKSRAEDRGIYNISYIRANLETPQGSSLPENSQDMVFLANILFQSQKKEDIVKEAYRVTKPGGTLVMIDWLPNTVFGPKEEGWKFSPDKGQQLAEKAGFSFKKKIPVSKNHWGLLFTK